MNYQKLNTYISPPEILEDALRMFENSEETMGFEVELEALQEMYKSLADEDKGSSAGRYLIIRIGELHFHYKDYEEAKYNFAFAMRFPDTIGNPFLHLRLGQLNYYLQEEERLVDELSRALIMGGMKIYEGEAEHFIQIPLEALRPPADCSWEEYEGQDWLSTK